MEFFWEIFIDFCVNLSTNIHHGLGIFQQFCRCPFNSPGSCVSVSREQLLSHRYTILDCNQHDNTQHFNFFFLVQSCGVLPNPSNQTCHKSYPWNYISCYLSELSFVGQKTIACIVLCSLISACLHRLKWEPQRNLAHGEYSNKKISESHSPWSWENSSICTILISIYEKLARFQMY